MKTHRTPFDHHTHLFTIHQCLYFKKSLRRVHCLIGQLLLNLTILDSHLILLFSYFKASKFISRALLFSLPVFAPHLLIFFQLSFSFKIDDYCFPTSLHFNFPYAFAVFYLCSSCVLLRGLPGSAPDLCNSAGSFLIYCTGVQRHRPVFTHKITARTHFGEKERNREREQTGRLARRR